MNPFMTPFDEILVREINRITDRRQGAFERVYPHDVAVYIPFERSIRQLRRDMAKLAAAGVLERIGQRGGYRLSVKSSAGW
ncbi:MAG: hypothetical protein D6712_04735 [Chloroflexi bacterium]|nr:MAG: hypothetical protein D6712_04735 [Chloroflexota bacterium]